MPRFNHTSGQDLDILDAKIYYEVLGDTSAPVLLFLHGGLGTIESFNPILEEFANDYRIIGIDNRGHGKSTLGPHELSYELLQSEVEAVLQHLNINSLSIIGFSNGGTIAYRLAAMSHLKINKLITIGAPWRSMEDAEVIESYSNYTSEIWKQQYPRDYENYLRLNPENKFDMFFNLLKKMALDMSAKSQPNERIKNIKCPSLILRGESDPVISDVDLREICKLIKNSQINTIPGANHEVMHDQPELLTNKISVFFTSLTFDTVIPQFTPPHCHPTV